MGFMARGPSRFANTQRRAVVCIAYLLAIPLLARDHCLGASVARGTSFKNCVLRYSLTIVFC
jgi:hypothetical protein